MSYTPYKESSLIENVFIRKFSISINPDELKWHWDKEDRTFEVISGEGWLFQQDNQLPFHLIKGNSVNINKNEYHRIINDNAKSELIIKLRKYK